MGKCFRFLIFLPLLMFAGAALAQEPPDWINPFPPYRIIGNIYYVGSQGLASYLITTAQGNILINSNLEKSVPMIRDSIEKLGFHFSDQDPLNQPRALGSLLRQRGSQGTDCS